MDSTKPSPRLRAALDAARAAAPAMLAAYRSDPAVNYKSDDSPVTAADVAAERTIVARLRAAFPDDGVYGEELGGDRTEAEYLWLIDPIDGTKSFVRGCPFFSTQIALMHRGELLLGVSNAPAHGQLAWAERGGGAWLNGESLSVAPAPSLSRAVLSIGNISTLAADARRWSALGELMRAVHRHRGYGDFLHYHLLAAGALDVVIEADVNILDVAALSVIVTEAGGVFTALDGESLNLETRDVLAAAAPALHAEVRSRMGT